MPGALAMSAPVISTSLMNLSYAIPATGITAKRAAPVATKPVPK